MNVPAEYCPGTNFYNQIHAQDSPFCNTITSVRYVTLPARIPFIKNSYLVEVKRIQVNLRYIWLW